MEYGSDGVARGVSGTNQKTRGMLPRPLWNLRPTQLSNRALEPSQEVKRAGVLSLECNGPARCLRLMEIARHRPEIGAVEISFPRSLHQNNQQRTHQTQRDCGLSPV